MSTTLRKYQIYCNTEEAFVAKWRLEPPTVCPNNPAHDVNSESVYEDKVLDIGPSRSVTAADSPVAATSTEGAILADATSGAVTINLPDATDHKYKMYYVIKTDSSANSVYVDGFGSQTVGGIYAYVLAAQNDDIAFISDGSNWSTNPEDIKLISNTTVQVNEDEQTITGKKTFVNLLFDTKDPEHLKNGGSIVLRSPNGNRWGITVDNSGTLVVSGV